MLPWPARRCAKCCDGDGRFFEYSIHADRKRLVERAVKPRSSGKVSQPGRKVYHRKRDVIYIIVLRTSIFDEATKYYIPVLTVDSPAKNRPREPDYLQ